MLLGGYHDVVLQGEATSHHQGRGGYDNKKVPAHISDSRATTMDDKTNKNADEGEPQVPEWEIKAGKIIFYITCALSLWFFYWLNGIQCPC